MTATRKHLPGLELALERWNDGGPAIQYGKLLSELIEQAQSAPEPVQGEAVEVVANVSTMGFGKHFAMGIGESINKLTPGDELMAVAQHQRIMAAAVPAGCKAVPVELLELLEQIAVELEHDNDRYFLGRELRALLASAEGVKDE